MYRRILFPAALVATLALAAAPAAAATPGAPATPGAVDEVQRAWLWHRQVTLHVDTPDGPADGPSAALPDATVYLIAPVDPEHPQDPGIVLEVPGGPTIVVPVHDTVVDQVRPRPVDCFGVQVRPGPAATGRTVLTRPDPNGGATLAYAVVLGPVRLPLTSRAAITVAARLGLVTLDSTWPGYGGRCWTPRSHRPTGR